jgi:phage baseplate assembly protein W
VVGGRVAWSEGDRNIRECVEIILKTELRERLQLPDFGAGLGQLLFEANTTTTRRQIQDRITRALVTWEPRIAVDSITVTADADDAEAATATINYRLVATGVEQRVDLSVALAG